MFLQLVVTAMGTCNGEPERPGGQTHPEMEDCEGRFGVTEAEEYLLWKVWLVGPNSRPILTSYVILSDLMVLCLSFPC